MQVSQHKNFLLPTRQTLKCANNSNVAHILIYETADMKQLILKTKHYATLCNFPGNGNKLVVAWAFPRDHIGVVGTVVT